MEPRYASQTLNASDYTNQLTCILSPQGVNGSLVAQQDVYMYYCLSDTDKAVTYQTQGNHRRVFIYVIEGQLLIHDRTLTKGDGYGILECEDIDLKLLPDAEILLFDMAK